MINLIKKTRTFRRFEENRKISSETLHQLIDLARLGGSARNCQPWQYMAITDPEMCKRLFPYLGWAGYLSDWKGPVEGEQPSCYILCFLNKIWLKGTEKEAHFDLGTATQNLLLGAREQGIGGCRIGAFSPHLTSLFDIPEHLSLSLVLALGYPVEEVVIEESSSPDDIKYWRDDNQVHHVPKRSLDDIIVELESLT